MHIFVDESGKPEVYSAKGTNLVEAGTATRHLVLAAIKTQDQLTLQRKVTRLRTELLEDDELSQSFSASYSLHSFHAHADYPEVRQRFYTFISSLHAAEAEIHVIVAEKLACRTALTHNPSQMYGLLAGTILQGICHQEAQAEIIFSRQDNGRKIRQELELEAERIRLWNWRRHSQPHEDIRISYQHNPHFSHGGLQVADYVAYAVFQHFEKGNSEYLQLIQPRIRHIYHYTKNKHFTRSRPLELS